MSSTNKTQNLRLNNWLGSDKPSRFDFNRDNEIIDSVVSEHKNDMNIHTTADEKNIWNTPYYMATYFGSGTTSRTITMDISFQPKWGIVFAANTTPSVNDFKNTASYNYFAIVSQNGSTSGVTLNGKKLTVTQSAIAILGNEYRSFNESGMTYIYIMFR